MPLDESKVKAVIEQFQKEIPIIHKCSGEVEKISIDRQSEIPVIHKMALSMPLIEKERAFFYCQAKAQAKYHLDCAAAERKLAASLERCSKLLVPKPVPKKKKKR